MTNTLLEITNLKKKYGKMCVLNIPELTLEKGKVYGLIGDNGAGKTTLFRLLTGIDFPSEGEIVYADTMIQKAALIEQPAIDLSLSGYDNLKYMNYLYGNKGDGKIEEVLKLVNLWDDRKRNAKTYSLGMKQRLGIAMTLMGNPNFLLLDEPINGVDPHGVVEFREIIGKISEMGVSMMISSHILAELYKVATDFIFMKKGEIVRILTEQEIEEQQDSRYLILTDDNERAVLLLKEKTNVDIALREDNRIVLKTSEDELMAYIDYLREQGLRLKEYYQYQFDLETFFKEEI